MVPLAHSLLFFFLNDPATTEIYPLSLHGPLPISHDHSPAGHSHSPGHPHTGHSHPTLHPSVLGWAGECERSEEHTSELQSQSNLVCRLLLEKKNKPSRGRTNGQSR